MDGKQRKQLDKAYEKGRLDGLRAADYQDEAIFEIERQWSLLANDAKILRMKEDALDKFKAQLHSVEDDLQKHIEVQAELLATARFEVFRAGYVTEHLKIQTELKEKLEEAEVLKAGLANHEAGAMKLRVELANAVINQQELNTLLANQISELANVDVLKEVLLDLELDQDPGTISTRLRERFGLLVAKW